MITRDDHDGLKAALKATFNGVPWNRCQCHLQRNAMAYVPKLHLRAAVAEDIRNIFNSPDRQPAELKPQRRRQSLTNFVSAQVPVQAHEHPQNLCRMLPSELGLDQRGAQRCG
jgi:transposase-like protein